MVFTGDPREGQCSLEGCFTGSVGMLNVWENSTSEQERSLGGHTIGGQHIVSPYDRANLSHVGMYAVVSAVF